MSVNSNSSPIEPEQPKPFSHLVIIQPLGLLYGSAGRFLSPENLVGRSGSSFPPSAATLSGIFAAELGGDNIKSLQLAGPFWAWSRNPQNFYVPAPLNCLVKKQKIQHQIAWYPQCKEQCKGCKERCKGQWLAPFRLWQNNQEKLVGLDLWKTPPNDKFEKQNWLPIRHWKRLIHKKDKERKIFQGHLPQEESCFPTLKVESAPWKFVPHLHPRLQEEQRRVVNPEDERERGSLFLENAVHLNPDACLIYLSNTPIPDGWYNFGGEGHLVDLQCQEICPTIASLLEEDLGHSFALITPAVWGSNRHSYREPMVQKDREKNSEWVPAWECETLLTERPFPFRYRLGNPKKEGSEEKLDSKEKLLSRGRYALPAGTVYVLKEPLKSYWQEWDENWFPKEGFYFFKRWGCGLALPLPSAIAQTCEKESANTSENLPLGDN